MIDEKTDELISRYLDRDLSNEERRDFECRLEAEEDLREACEGARSLAVEMRRLALEERAPDDLDRMVRPLREAGRPNRRLWTGAALAAAAAVLVVGSILVLEVGRTGWRSWLEKPSEGKREVFALSNPPSRDPNAPIGAIESLMAEPLADPELAEPEAFEIIGPVDWSPDGGLVVVIGDLSLQVQDGAASVGTIVRVEISGRRVTSCLSPDETGVSPEVDEVCRVLRLLEDINLDDGFFAAEVVRSSVR